MKKSNLELKIKQPKALGDQFKTQGIEIELPYVNPLNLLKPASEVEK